MGAVADEGALQQERAAEKGAPKEGITSVVSALFLLSCQSLGVGVFAMPPVFVQLGLVLGTALLLVFAALSTAMMQLTLRMAEARGFDSWRQLIGLVPGGPFVSHCSLFLGPVIGNAAHLQAVAGMIFDFVVNFMPEGHQKPKYTVVWQICFYLGLLALGLPLCFKQDLRSLQGIGWLIAVVVIATCVSVVFVAGEKIGDGSAASGDEAVSALPGSVSDVLKAIPIICFAFTSMLNCFDVFKAMKKGSPTDALPKMLSAVTWAGVLLATVYLSVALFASLAYGREAGQASSGHGSGNVLYNIPVHNYAVTALRVALIVVITLDYPIINFAPTSMLLGLRSGALGKHRWARGALSLAIAAFILLLNLAVPDLGAIFGLCGSLSLSLFCYALPGLVIIWAHPSLAAKAVGAASAFLGFLMLFVSTGFIVAGLVE